MADRPENRCFGLLGETIRGPTLVAMATKFWQIWAIFSQNRL